MENAAKCRGLSLLSGGLDSQLAVCVLRDAGAYVEGVCFETPFFGADRARAAAEQLGIKLHVVDFTDDEIALIKDPPHGFGSAMNPCIDCHATMIRRAGEMMERMGFDFVSTGEVLNQRPMSQNRQSLGVVEKSSGLSGRLVRPLSAGLLEPTIPETQGLLDRSKLLSLSGRRRDPQIELAERYGLRDYPSPAGGCKLTEEGFSNRLRDLMEHEGLDEMDLVRCLPKGRRFRLAGGSGVVLGRDAAENEMLESIRRGDDVVLRPVSVGGPTAFIPVRGSFAAPEEDVASAAGIVAAWSRPSESPIAVEIVSSGGTVRTVELAPPFDRGAFRPFQIM